MGYPDAAWERAMTVQEVMLKAVSGELHWFQAADILGWSPRTVRRWRVRYEEHGYAGLVDKRLLRPSKRRVPPGAVERVLRLYRERYAGFNVRHFHQIAQREHGITVSYSFVNQALQAAKLVKKHRARGRHRRRREPRACFGEMLHLDGSVHEWFTLDPDARAVSDRGVGRCDQARTPRRVLSQREYLVGDDQSGGRPAHRGAPHGPLHRSGALSVPYAHSEGAGRQDAPHAGRPGSGTPRHRAHPVVLPAGAGPERTPESDVAGPPRQRVACGGYCHARGRESLSRRALPARAQCDVRVRAARPRECVRAAGLRRPRSDPLS